MKTKSFVIYGRAGYTRAKPGPGTRLAVETPGGRVYLRLVCSRYHYSEAIDHAAKPRSGETLLNSIPNNWQDA
jgi:hypothetical protein